MANRTYLYAVRPYEDGSIQLVSVGEHRSDIPFMYQLLCSVNTEQLPSKLFDDQQPLEDTGEIPGPTAFRGSFVEGRNALVTFMEEFAELNSRHLYLPEDTVAEEFASTKNDLFSARFDGCTHYWLEPIEVFDLVGYFNEQAGMLKAQIDAIPEKKTAIMRQWAEGDFTPYRSAQEMFYALGAASWSHILFYEFGNNRIPNAAQQ